MLKSTTDIIRVRANVSGAVQGVGFRPFVWRLANSIGLTGWVSNSDSGAIIEIEGEADKVETFLECLRAEKPAHAKVTGIVLQSISPQGDTGFAIRSSETQGQVRTLVLPDIAICGDCLRELNDPQDRRYRYPFINCTNCGPRFSIIEGAPYDRSRTTMKKFAMCPACHAEYTNPADRRFHAQPIVCKECGPQLEYLDENGAPVAKRDDALKIAEAAIRAGQIVAVKGLGGFHLVVDAGNSPAVQRLRQRKHREEKPLAVMFPDLESVRQVCLVAGSEAALLCSPEAPIVLLQRRSRSEAAALGVAKSVAPGNPYLGVMLPYTPLHRLLLSDLGFPVVATSGNIPDEPICIDNEEAVERLRGIADGFLVHNRPIARQVDDSVVRIIDDRPYFIRRSRGYAPLPVEVKDELSSTLAVGAHQKNTIAFAVHGGALVSQHIGDLETVEATTAFRRVISDLTSFHRFTATQVACDLHPDYISSQYARTMGVPVAPVQHHVAHVVSCMAENDVIPPVLGIAWDGSGYGTDGTIWGGEFIVINDHTWRRAARFRTFMLPGGDRAIKEPRRSALGALYEMWGEALFSRTDIALLDSFTSGEMAGLAHALDSRLNCPRTSSVGRLFDAVAALCGLRHICSFEGQAAMELEFCADTQDQFLPYSFDTQMKDGMAVVDWIPMVSEILYDLSRSVVASVISSRFHATLVEMIVAVAKQIGITQVALTGGCFQNKLLVKLGSTRLKAEGFSPILHRQVPCNDGGIALGQLVAATRGLREEK